MTIKKYAISSLFLFLLNGCVLANEQSEHYVFHYSTGDTYDVQLTENTITWTGLEGSDTGLTETDMIKRKNLTDDVEVIQWIETSGAFITMTLDRLHQRVVSSGKSFSPNYDWLADGTVEKK